MLNSLGTFKKSFFCQAQEWSAVRIHWKKNLPKLLLQAWDVLADTLGYWSYENRSSDSGRAIAQEKGGKVNWYNMCAGQVLHFFTAELKSDSKQKLLRLSCKEEEKGVWTRAETHTEYTSTNSIRMGETLRATFLRKQTPQTWLYTNPAALFINVSSLNIPPFKVFLQLCDEDEKWPSGWSEAHLVWSDYDKGV